MGGSAGLGAGVISGRDGCLRGSLPARGWTAQRDSRTRRRVPGGRAVVAGLRRVGAAVSAVARRGSLCRGGRFGSPQALSSVRGAVRPPTGADGGGGAPVRRSAGGDEGVVGGRRGAIRAPGTALGSRRRAELPGEGHGRVHDAADGRGSTRQAGPRRRDVARRGGRPSPSVGGWGCVRSLSVRGGRGRPGGPAR